MKYQIKEENVYCFIASLERTNGNSCFDVPFKVLAEDLFKAQTILEEWLKKPEQTGYKFSRCIGITRKASERILVIDRPPKERFDNENKTL